MESLCTLIELFRTDGRPTLVVDAFQNDEKALLRYSNPAYASRFSDIDGIPMLSEEDSVYVLARLIEPSLSDSTPYFDVHGFRWRCIPFTPGLAVIQLAGMHDIEQCAKHAPPDSHRLLDALQRDEGLCGAVLPSREAGSHDLLAVKGGQKVKRSIQPELEDLPIGYASFDPDGTVRYANKAYLDLAGSARIDLQQDQLGEAVISKERKLFHQQFNLIMAGKCPDPFEIQVQRPWLDGQPRTWLMVNCYFKGSECGRSSFFVICLTDMSGRRHQQDGENQKAVENLDHKTQNEQFVDMVLHELKNTISAISQSSDLIASATRDLSKQKAGIFRIISDAAGTIELCAEQQRRIITDVLTLSRVRAHGLEIVLHEASPIDLLGQTVRLFSREAKAAGIALQTRVIRECGDPDLAQGTVLLDSGRLLQILINLTANAVKFTRGRTERSITISLAIADTRPAATREHVSYLPRAEHHAGSQGSTTADEGEPEGEPIYLQFAVGDTGTGLSPSEMKKLFNRFTQASPHVHGKHGGHGLGLYIARHLTELQHGQICVSSEAGRGSTFAFYVQARRQQSYSSSGTTTCRPPIRSIGSAVTLDNAPCFVSKHVVHCLVVDDNQIIRRLLAQQLQRLELRVSVAGDGLEALSLIQEAAKRGGTPVSAVLMDLNMPIMDGLTCVQEIRHLERGEKLCGHLPVIGVTGSSRPEEIARAIEQGMDTVIAKPFRLSEILLNIDALVRKFTDHGI